MKNFGWILLSGLLVAATSVAHAQAPGGPGAFGGPGAPGSTGTTDEAGGISNAPVASTTTTTTTTGVAPDASFVPADDAAIGTGSFEDSSSMPDTGGEPMIAVLAGLSIAGAALAMRRKVTA